MKVPEGNAGRDERVSAATCVWIVAAATVWASFLRLHQLENVPPQAWVDEVWYNLQGRYVARTWELEVFYPTFWGGMSSGMVAVAALLHAAGHQGIVASRLASAFAGIATVPLAYVALNELWIETSWTPARRRFIAALAAVVTASLPFLIIASRIGWEIAVVPPLTLLYIWQWRRAQRRGALTNWIAAGLALGISFYFGLHGRLVVVLAGALAFHDLFTAPRSRRSTIAVGLAVVAAVSGAVALPLIVFFIQQPYWLSARLAHVTHGLRDEPASYVLQNLGKVLGSVVLWGDTNPRHNLPGRPMLDVVQAAGFLVGMVWLLKAVRRQEALWLLAWLALMLLPSILSDEAPQFERLIGAGVPLAAIVAIGWMATIQLVTGLMKRAPPLRQRSLAGIGAGLIVVSSGATAYELFSVYPGVPELPSAMTTYPVELAGELIGRASEEEVLVERPREAADVFAFAYLFPGTNVRRADFRTCLPLVDGRATRTTYLTYPARDPRALRRLRDAYPDAAAKQVQPEAATLMPPAVIIEVPAKAKPRVQYPRSARFANGLELLGFSTDRTTYAPGDQLGITTFWRVASVTNAAGYVLTARLDEPGSTAPIATAEMMVCRGLRPAQWREGDVIAADTRLDIPARTDSGDYVLSFGWLEHPQLRQITLRDANPPSQDRAHLATITVVALMDTGQESTTAPPTPTR